MSCKPTEQIFPIKRIAWLDLSRTVALLGMFIFHFARDLQFFGLVAPGITSADGWAVFARLIAGSFLFLSGISLYLAHGQKIRFHAFFKRLAVLALSAALVSVATWVAMPQSFIFFGILHSIAVASLTGLLFLRLPAFVTFGTALVIIMLPQIFRSDLFDFPALLWVGFSTEVPRTMDFEPVFPWLAAFLLGMVAAKVAFQGRISVTASTSKPHGKFLDALAWPGRHSLAIYLLHQPVLFGAIWLVIQLTK